jgi:hypothetical protein
MPCECLFEEGENFNGIFWQLNFVEFKFFGSSYWIMEILQQQLQKFTEEKTLKFQREFKSNLKHFHEK